MLTLFFEDATTTISTVLLVAVLAFIAYHLLKQKEIERWGRRSLILVISGLILCSFVCMRDGYVDSLQGGTGLFSLDSAQIFLAYAAAAVIAVSAISSIFVRNQKYRKVMFFILSVSIIFKVVLIEVSRVLMV